MRTFISVICLFGICLVSCEGVSNPIRDSKTKLVKGRDSEHVENALTDASVVVMGEWIASDDESKSILYIARKVPIEPGRNEIEFKVLARSGETIYQRSFPEIGRVYTSYLLRQGDPQLVIEYGGGGQDMYILILDNVGGKIVDLTRDEGTSMSFGSDSHVSPQFSGSPVASAEPFEVLLTNDGLASPTKKVVSVYRFKNGQYRLFGEYSRSDADNCVEHLIKPKN